MTAQEALARLTEALVWIEEAALSVSTLLQFLVIALAFALSFVITRWLGPLLEKACGHFQAYQKIAPFIMPLFLPLLWLFFVGGGHAVLVQFGQPVYLTRIASSLLMAWLVIRFASNFIRNPELAKLFAVVAWFLAALNIAGLLDPAISLLDSAAITFGETRISLLGVVKGLLTFAIMIWLALVIARVLEQSLNRMPTLTPSAQVLLGKLGKIVLITLAVLIAITSTGIDLTALAVFGGAIGVGIGFGLQKVVSNLISGVILLLDRSIKPGDVIEVGGTYGWINKLAARYTSVITRDGREHLVPNEDMITMPVINWTYSSTKVRRHVPVGVSYNADLHKAMELVVEAAMETRRVLDDPEPRCLVKGFGDSAVDLELRMWIGDPQNGVSNVASEVLLKIWDKFHAHGIEIPYPQRDLHIVSAPGLDGRLNQAGEAAKKAKPEPDEGPEYMGP
ncbi:MAG: mechanosensitive ion channel protein MscS [Alphaproteobacteria bacterium]|nr:MAG: mechanosensitive ion channel protein MscS [Alphaproteobacteria bacterium]